jgi:hypothetical protein
LLPVQSYILNATPAKKGGGNLLAW